MSEDKRAVNNQDDGKPFLRLEPDGFKTDGALPSQHLYSLLKMTAD